MKNTLALLFLVLMLSSCATIINQRYIPLDVYTNEPATIIVDIDTVETIENRATFWVERQKEPLEIIAISNSLTKQLSLKSKNSFAYALNAWPSYGIGYFLEMNNPKRYTYPKSIYLDMTDSSPNFLIHALPRKDELYFNLSIPYFNSFLLQPLNDSGIKTNTGFWGATFGLDFYYSDKRFINFSATLTDDFDHLITAFDTEEEDESFLASYVSLSHHHQINRFSVGYGITYGEYEYYYRNIERGDFGLFQRDRTVRYRSLGMIFPAYVQLGEYFQAGFIYRPTYIRYDIAPKLKYEHLMSLVFSWKIRVSK